MSVLESLNGDYSPFLAADIEVISRPDSELRSQVTSALLRRGHRAGFVPLPVAPSRELDRFDLLVLEPDPGDPDALRICSTIRDFTRVPLLVIVPLTSRSRGIQALDLGADSFMLAPFDRRELLARCEALIRRYRQW
ncbi:MAG: hypothetical protein KDI07_14960 [Anaerolineae bacterium]|nr:hypothetical protein [Anaerolineae bacterium]MCB0239545.1 hypothetical protein [Anaerolineae bacterium]MCB0249873.1 hypothetical protein [Anaerolineae bacterium]MCO5243095.1 hypothetical protein [Anaerolineae bacterium]HRX04190.1 hypothetical protein [Anaerolineae bacterium]